MGDRDLAAMTSWIAGCSWYGWYLNGSTNQGKPGGWASNRKTEGPLDGFLVAAYARKWGCELRAAAGTPHVCTPHRRIAEGGTPKHLGVMHVGKSETQLSVEGLAPSGRPRNTHGIHAVGTIKITLIDFIHVQSAELRSAFNKQRGIFEEGLILRISRL